MNPVAVILSAAFVSFGVSYAVVTFATPEAKQDVPRVASESVDDDARDRIAALEAQIQELKAAATTGAGPRAAVAEDIDARIAAAVARAMESGGKPADADDPSGDLNVDAMVVEMMEDGVHPAVNAEAWERIKAAGKVDEVVAAFKRRADENPNDADAQAQYGDALLTKLWEADSVVDQGRFGGMADAAWSRALEIDETHWSARFNKAVSYTFWPDFTGKPAEAVGHFETLMAQQEASPDPSHTGHAETYLMLGNLYSSQGKSDKAKEIWSRGLRNHPDDQRFSEKLK